MKKRIAIIGAGFTGLTAAHELIKRGVNAQIEIFERSDLAGGLAAGFPLCGTSLEKTYHYLFLTDTCILSLARELGLEDHLLWGESTTAIFYGDRLYPFTTPLDLLRFSPCGVFDRFRLGLVM